jgi:Response regulator containing a CheY-like receiver domain and an HTH DNA-binding domain
MATRVFIVDDHYMIIEGIRSLLLNNPDIELIGHAMSAGSCMAFLQKTLPDVILMDINLPDRSGIELCFEVSRKYPEVRIIGLSTFSQQSMVEKMMESGALGYVLKNGTREELIDGISACMRGEKYLSGDISRSIQKNAALRPVLTRREKEVLCLIAEGLTNSEVAEKLFVSTATVDTHRKNLLSKFDARNTASLIRLATQHQFI